MTAFQTTHAFSGFSVDDIDPPDGHYGLVNLDDPRLIAQDGWAPSEGNPHFHQQMVYAVALKTIENFETALGRRCRQHCAPAGEPALVRRIRIHGRRTVAAEQHAGSFLAACSEFGRNHKAVTAVVAGPADDTE